MEMDQVIGQAYDKMISAEAQGKLNALRDAYIGGLANGQVGQTMPAPVEDTTPYSQDDLDAAVEQARLELHALVEEYKMKMDQALSDDEIDKAKVAAAEAMKEQVTAKLIAIKAALVGIALEVPAPTPAPQEPVEETPVEETPVEQAPVEETPVEQAPVEETQEETVDQPAQDEIEM